MLLYVVWMFLFSIELGILISISWFPGVIIYICCLFAGIVLVGFADYLRSFNKKKVRRRVM